MKTHTYRHFLQERIVYGGPADKAVVSEAEALGARRVFLTTTRSLGGENGLAAKIAKALGDRHAGTYVGIAQHSPDTTVVAAAVQARTANADLIVAIGGGSVIDGTKVVLHCLWNNINSVADLIPVKGPTLDPSRRPAGMDHVVRMIAVPTTFSGAEFTVNGGVVSSRSQAKEYYGHPLMIPMTVILDPAATATAPLDLLLSTGIKAVDHVVERLCNLTADAVTEAICAPALGMLIEALPAIKARPDDLEARLQGLIGMWMANTSPSTGVPVGASHAIGRTLGGSFNMRHGVTSCVCLPAVLKWSLPANVDRQRKVSVLMGDPSRPAADLVAEFVAGLDLPGRLRDAGIKREDFEKIARETLPDPRMKTHPRPITKMEEIFEILELAW